MIWTPPIRHAAAWAVLALACTAAGCGGGGQPSDPVVPDAPLVALPADAPEPLGARLFPPAGVASDRCVFRTWPSELIVAYEQCSGTAPRRMSFDRGAQGELLLLTVVESGDTNGDLVAFTYDARRNIPSGRIPGIVAEGVDVWRIRGNGQSSELLAAEQPLGGFDNLIHARADGTSVTACAVRRCLHYEAGSPPREWALAALAGYELVDLRFSKGEAHALLRRLDDGLAGAPVPLRSHYAYALLDAAGARVEPLPQDCLPFGFGLAGAQPAWRCARTPADLAQLFAEDLARMPHGGLMDYGASNQEGRIAWSQAYYLGALMDLAAGRMPNLAAARDWRPLSRRLRHEVDLLARRADDHGAGFAARRYSVHREPLVFALHLGRIAQVLATARNTGHDSMDVARARAQVAGHLESLSGTIEQLSVASDGNLSYTTLRLSRAADFWCDGAVVPFNFNSAYVSGLLALDGDDKATQARAAALLGPLLGVELAALPQTWRYWWSEGRTGWTASDALSVNTPQYAGFSGLAHITYRTMDAAAVVAMHSRDPASIPAGLVEHFSALVSQGSLLPSLNAQLNRPAALNMQVAVRHGRSVAPWELPSQLWALERLASTP